MGAEKTGVFITDGGRAERGEWTPDLAERTWRAGQQAIADFERENAHRLPWAPLRVQQEVQRIQDPDVRRGMLARGDL